MSDANSDGKAAPPTPAAGFGPNAGGSFSQKDYTHPAAGWGASKSVALVLLRAHELIDGTRAVLNMNHENGGYDCPGCAWPDDRRGLRLDICENGIKHATWEMTKKRVTRDFFAAHTVAELSGWTDFALERWVIRITPLAAAVKGRRICRVQCRCPRESLDEVRVRDVSPPVNDGIGATGRQCRAATIPCEPAHCKKSAPVPERVRLAHKRRGQLVERDLDGSAIMPAKCPA